MIRRARGLAVEAWLPVVAVAAWWFGSLGSESLYFPPLRDIAVRFKELWLFEQVPVHLFPSLRNFAAGLTLGLAVAVALGVLLGLVPILRRATEPLLELARATPALALLPLTIVFLGTGSTQKVLIIAFACMWPTLLNTVDGVRGVDPLLRDLARGYGLRRRDLVLRMVLPASMPQVMAGVRSSVSIAVVAMVGSELYASSEGIGYFVLQSQRTYAVDDMWAGLVMLGLLGYVINLLSALAEKGVLGWHQAMRQTAAKQS